MAERDYVLGTHDEELARLGLQHLVWRPRALDAWRRAGISREQRVVDLGAGPGYAALDLAEIVGPRGEVVAIDRSARFLAALKRNAAIRGLDNIVPMEADLDAVPLSIGVADAVWCRWIFTFLPRPRRVLEDAVRGLRPGGAIVIHEYLDYATWRMVPTVATFEAFVSAVMASWRADGGEPNIGAALPAWLEAAGCRVEAVTPIVDVVDQTNFVWQWPNGFFESGLTRLVDIGRLSASEAMEMRNNYREAWSDPQMRLMTPLVGEIIARKI